MFTTGDKVLHVMKEEENGIVELSRLSGVPERTILDIMAGIRERLEGNDIPKAFQGMPIVLITSGLMAIAFCGFAGVV